MQAAGIEIRFSGNHDGFADDDGVPFDSTALIKRLHFPT
jgi:hypothetical protein